MKTVQLPEEWKYFRVLEAVRALNGPASVKSIAAWLATNYPGENHSDARANASLLSVNDPNRRHHDHGRRDFRSDTGNPKDVLFRTGRFRNVRYEVYRPAEHGIWDLRRNADDSWEAIQTDNPVSPVDAALREAQEQMDTEEAAAQPIDNEHDARVAQFRAIAQRTGQSKFRDALLDAYGGRCAITGCEVAEILEAAHVCPYRGEHTNRVDNGLLLRADVHTLFDKGMIYIDAEGFVQLDKRLEGSEYAPLHGSKLRSANHLSPQPHPEHLASHRQHAARKPD